MFEKAKWGAVTLASVLLAGSLGFASPALAQESVPTGETAKSYLTKVIDAPLGTDASQDTYVFHFQGGGTTGAKIDGEFIADGIKQDSTTMKAGDTVPAIPDLTLYGRQLTEDNTKTKGSFSQTTVQASLAYILGEADATRPDDRYSSRPSVTFAHAGVYTYRVTETSANAKAAANHITQSKASYMLRVTVKNAKDSYGNEKTVVENVTVEKEKDDGGNELTGENKKKVDPTLPETESSGKITFETSEQRTKEEQTTEASGDERGRDVNGFTFANEYVKGDTLVVEKHVLGKYGDKDNKMYPVTLTIEDGSIPVGACFTYMISDGDDTTVTTDDQVAKTIDNVSNDDSHYGSKCVEAKVAGKNMVIKANLKQGGKITVTGLYGFASLHEGESIERRSLLTNGVKQGTKYFVYEDSVTNYTPSAFVYDTNAPTEKPVDNADGTAFTVGTLSAQYSAAKSTALEVKNYDSAQTQKTIVGEHGGYVYLVNTFDDTTVTPTGILINNLPYVLMVGIPVVVGVVMFVNKRRQADELD